MPSPTNPAEACMESLAAYLRTQIPGLTVYNEWPNANQVLNYPVVTLTMGQPKIMNLPPEQIAITTPDVDGKVTVTHIVGEVDFMLQLDLWTSNKIMRGQQLGLLFDAINAQVGDDTGARNAAGLSLQLTTYYNDWARFDLDGYRFADDEQAAQRQERRAKVDLLVNCRIIRERTLYAISKVDVALGVETKNSEMANDSTYTDTIHVVE